MQELGLVRAFPNLERLELRHYTHAAPQEYMSEYKQLTALTRLTSLKLDLDEHCHHPTLIQVSRYHAVGALFSVLAGAA